MTVSYGNGLENPKSAILHIPSCIRMFAGLRSLCMKLLLTISFSPLAIYLIIIIACSSGRVCCYARNYLKSGPLQYSVIT
jgi:hypothetical protein